MKRIITMLFLAAFLFGFQPVFGVTGTKKADKVICSKGSFYAGQKITFEFRAVDVNGLAYTGNFTQFSADSNYLPSWLVFGATSLDANTISPSTCLYDPNDPQGWLATRDIIVKATLSGTSSLFERSHREIPICAKDAAGNETWMWLAFDVVEPKDTQAPTIFGCASR